MSIVEVAAKEAAARGNPRVHAVHLRLGALSGVVKEALVSSFEMACVSSPLEGSQLLIEEVPVMVFCPSCQEAKTVASLQWMCCPHCGTPSPEVTQGKELEITALELAE
jgi:hydrogenase nickel incorporation protein HypA/HybF